MPGHVVYKLKEPIVFGEETITELKLRNRIVAGDMRGVPMRDPMLVDDLLKIAGRLCGQPDHVMNALSYQDFKEVGAIVEGFTVGGQTTGSEPSAS